LRNLTPSHRPRPAEVTQVTDLAGFLPKPPAERDRLGRRTGARHLRDQTAAVVRRGYVCARLAHGFHNVPAGLPNRGGGRCAPPPPPARPTRRRRGNFPIPPNGRAFVFSFGPPSSGTSRPDIRASAPRLVIVGQPALAVPETGIRRAGRRSRWPHWRSSWPCSPR